MTSWQQFLSSPLPEQAGFIVGLHDWSTVFTWSPEFVRLMYVNDAPSAVSELKSQLLGPAYNVVLERFA
jgi:hypothetical protein